MFLYNTLTKKKEKFKPLKEKKVGVYICGPTVYNHAHIGNLSLYLFSDLLIKYLKYSGYKVKSVMNITDIDDKIIKALKEKNKLNLIELKKFTEYFSKKFLKELKILDIVNIDFFPKATDYIPEMIDIIKVLIKKDLAYLSSDGSTYYKIKNFKNYGQLSGINKLKKKALKIKNNLEYKKEDLVDFVLWRAWTEEDGNIYWNSPWGNGRPGWHIECSAMSIKNLGKSFDIHIGAVDLIFPHHENEIAQSEGLTEQKFVSYWLHREHLMVNGKKMSKSLGNFYTLSDILKENNNSLVFRYLILTNHYRLNLNFTFKSLASADNSLKKIHNFINRLNSIKNKQNSKIKIDIKLLIDKNRKKFEKFMDDDLNVAKAIADLFSFISDINKLIDKNLIIKKQSLEILTYMREIDQVWGFIFNNNFFNLKTEEDIKNKLEILIKKRNYYRDKKEWAKADKIRDEIKELGFILIDDKNKTDYKKIRTTAQYSL